ncbi:MAG: cephalosporin hydroxylase family protein [marine benthic group bacterium]|nr:cephalosporin hydroxylase family protein [Gemmatimonadota bacterium]
MKKTARSLVIVGGIIVLFLVSNVASFLVGSYAPSRSAVWDAIARAGFTNRETMQATQAQTSRMLEQQDRILPVDEQKRIMNMWNDLQVWDNTSFLGIRVMKNPMDLWMMQYIISEVRPDYIVETGTAAGGSALYWAATLDLLGLESSRVITMDIEDYTEAVAERGLWREYVEFIHSSSTDPETVASIAERVADKTVMVLLDSNHEAHHVLQELRMYGPLVSPGSYLIVEDTHLDGIPVAPEWGPGPMTALNEYLDTGGAELYEQDFTREAHVLTQNPGGWLRRKSQ